MTVVDGEFYHELYSSIKNRARDYIDACADLTMYKEQIDDGESGDGIKKYDETKN